MRFIARPRQVTTEGINTAFTTGPFQRLRQVVLPYALTEINFLSSYSFEVPDRDLPAWNAALPRLEREANAIIRAARSIHGIQPPADPDVTVPASLGRLGLQPLWDDSITGQKVPIGVIDEGFGMHPCLSRAIESHQHYDPRGKKFVDRGRPGNKVLQHGTFAAALIAGGRINGVQIGVAPDARLHLVELPEVKFEDDLALAIEFLAVEKQCRVISISLGSWEPADQLDTALQKARSAGALTVAAIGNDGKGVAMWPGACSYALSVGYCDERGMLTTTSGSTHFERGRQPLVPLVIAPGVMLNSADVDTGGICQKSGSSFATPLVAGLAGLLMSGSPTSNIYQVEDAITTTCVVNAAYQERCAFGVPDAVAALDNLKGITMR